MRQPTPAVLLRCDHGGICSAALGVHVVLLLSAHTSVLYSALIGTAAHHLHEQHRAPATVGVLQRLKNNPGRNV